MIVPRPTRPFLRHPLASVRFRFVDRVARYRIGARSNAAPRVPPEAVLTSVAGHQLTVVGGDGGPTLQNETALRVDTERPACRIVQHAVYVPASDPRRVGTGLILDDRGRVVEEARLVRDVPSRPAHPADGAVPSRVSGHLAGSAIYVGHLGFRHIGHFLTEGIARLWYVAELGDSDDRPLVHHGPAAALDQPVARALLTGLGIPVERFVNPGEPTSIDELVVPSPSMVNLATAATAHRSVAERAAAGLGVGIDAHSGACEGPAYLSRSRLPPTTRLVAGECALERILGRHGVRIVHPQELPVADQIEVFARHRPVVGPLGSAFHLSLFAGAGGRHVYLADSVGPANPNFFLLDATGGIDGAYLRCVDPLPGRRAKPDGRLRPETPELVRGLLGLP